MITLSHFKHSDHKQQRSQQCINRQMNIINMDNIDGIINQCIVYKLSQIMYSQLIVNKQVNQLCKINMNENNTENTIGGFIIDDNDIIFEMVKQYNANYEKYENELAQQSRKHKQQLQVKQEQYGNRIIKLQNKYEIDANRYERQIQNRQKQKQQVSKQMENKINKIEQLLSIISNLQYKLQKYEYQLCEKNAYISSLHQQIKQAIQQSHNMSEAISRKCNELLSEYQSNQQSYIVRLKQFNECQGRENELAIVLSKLYAQIQQKQCKQQAVCYVQHQSQLSTQIFQQLVSSNWEQYERGAESWAKQSKAYINGLISCIRELGDKVRQYRYTSENTTHKYGQFLKQTQAKFAQYKAAMREQESMVKQKQCRLQQMQQIRDELNAVLARREEQNNKLKQVIASNLQSQLQLSSRVSELQQQIGSKLEQVVKVERQLKQEKDRNAKDTENMTLQVISLKQSISTLKNVISKAEGQQNAEVTSAMVQQMIDKTYIIRVENSQLKDTVQSLTNTLHSYQTTMQQLESTSKYIRQQNRGLKQQCQSLKIQISATQRKWQALQAQCEQQHNTLCQQYQCRYNAMVEQCENKLNAMQQTHSTEQQQLKETVLAAQQKWDSLAKEHYELKMKARDEQLVGAQIGEAYQLIQMLRLEIYVLNQIISRKAIASSAHVGVQVQLIVEQQRSQDYSPLPTTRYLHHSQTKCKHEYHNEPVGKLVNVLKQNKQSSTNNIQAVQLQKLNRTCKIRNNQNNNNITHNIIDSNSNNNNITDSIKNQVEQMNDIINYMVNLAKGYTRNGIRKYCWLSAQGEQYLLKIQNPKNIRQKYGNFQRIRSLTDKNQIYKQLLKDYEQIMNHYFGNLEFLQYSNGNLTSWESSQKQNKYFHTQNSKTSKIRFNQSTNFRTK